MFSGDTRRDHAVCYRDVAKRAVGVNTLHIELERLTSAERRDLANALLRAAWSATLAETRILLLELLSEADESVLGEPV
jgi:hypothetical protein